MREARERMTVVDVMMLPRPTSGETMPPKRKPDAPPMAEATPIWLRPSSMARVVVEVKMNPVNVSIRKVSDS